jgi:hypothetical protein
MTNKYIKDGCIGVLYSPEYGAGWSTWGKKEMAYDKDLVTAFLDGGKENLLRVTEEKYPNECTLGLSDIKIEWVAQGQRFYIEEYDGYESLKYASSDDFITA